MRFARKVEFTIRSGQEMEFTKLFDTKVLGMLQKQKGFQDEVILTHGPKAWAISLWDNKTNAETYEKTGYPKVLETLKPFIEGTPKIEPCDVVCSTMHAHV